MYLVPNKISGNSIPHFAKRDNEKPRLSGDSRGKMLLIQVRVTVSAITGQLFLLSSLTSQSISSVGRPFFFTV